MTGKVFQIWGGQHKRLRIPKKALPELSDSEIAILINCHQRYEIALGIIDPDQVGEPLVCRELYQTTLCGIIADYYETSIENARRMLLTHIEEMKNVCDPDDDDEDADDDVDELCWSRDDLLEFSFLLSRIPRSKIAMFIYIWNCDELADGIIPSSDIRGDVRECYEWALGFCAMDEKT